MFGDYHLVGFDARSGAQLWLIDTLAGAYVAAGVSLFQAKAGVVYVGSYLGAALAIDAATGAVLCRADVVPGDGNQVRVYAVDNDCVYLTVRYDGPFYHAAAYALDAATGGVVWTYDMGRSSAAQDVILASSATPQPLLVLALEAGRLVALEAATGKQVWEVAGSAESGSLRHLGALGSTLIATTTVPFPGYIEAYDINTGSQRWNVASRNGSADLSPVAISFDSNTPYVAFTNGVLGAYGLTTGQAMWFRRPPSGEFYATAAVSHDTLFIAGSEGAYAIAK